MKMKVLRALRTQAPRQVRRRGRAPAMADATMEPEPGPSPEEVFDRVTGPYGAGESHHVVDTADSHGQPNCCTPYAYGSPPACWTKPWQAYE